MFPLVTALPSTRSAARRGALFAGFFGTMLVSDCSGPCITGVELHSSRCGPRKHRVASPELSQFPCKECTRMLRLSDRAEPEKHSRFRAPRCCLPPAHQRRRSGRTAFAAPYPRLRAPLPTSRLPPHGDLRTARGRCGALDLHRRGLAPPAPCQSPGKSGRSVAVSASGERVSIIYDLLAFRLPRAVGGPRRLCERHQRFCSQRVDVALRHRPPPYGLSPQSLARAPLRLFGAGP
jgi:hypothetical protein